MKDYPDDFVGPRRRVYIVERDCCTSGNCVVCREQTPFRTPVRVEHLRTADRTLARKCKRNYSEYRAVVKIGK